MVAVVQYAVKWGDVAGLRRHFFVTEVARRSPIFVGLIGLNYAMFGRTSAVGTLMLAAFVYGLQSLVAYGASLATMPGSRHTFYRLVQLRNWKWLNNKVDLSSLDRAIEQMTTMSTIRTERGRQLLELGRVKLGSARRLALTAPDGSNVDGCLLGGDALASMVAAKRATSAEDEKAGCRGVLVYCGGNGEHYEFRPDLVTSIAEPRKLALCLFNYRGVGDSGKTGKAAAGAAGAGSDDMFADLGSRCSRNGGVLDVITVLSYLRTGLGVPANRIILVGHSIGGGYATEAATLFPGILTINDRSFSALSTVALYHVLPPLVYGPTSAAPWAAIARSAFVFLMRHVACWELDSAYWWAKLPKQGKVVVYSREDQVIPEPAQLLAGLMTGPPLETGVGTVLQMTYRPPPMPGHAPTDENDAHNGEWTRQECDRLDGVIGRFLRGHPLGDTA